MKTQRFFVLADDGENLELLTWTGNIESARNHAETAAQVRPDETIVIAQGVSSVFVETKLKWSDQCATSPASSPQSCG